MSSSLVALRIGQAECAIGEARKALDQAFQELKNTDAMAAELRALREFRGRVRRVLLDWTRPHPMGMSVSEVALPGGRTARFVAEAIADELGIDLSEAKADD